MNKLQSTRDMLGRNELTQVSHARTRLLTHLNGIKPTIEKIPLGDALGRITAEDILSPENLPPCERSTMDGYAVISSDTYGASQSLPAYLNITGEVEMGVVPKGSVTSGNCYKIPTGGILPEGADCVMMFEHTVPVDDLMIEIVKDIGSGTNMIKSGDDIGVGNVAVFNRTRLRPSDLGLLAGLGISEIRVFKKIQVGIISTGDEIIDYSQQLIPGKMRNINSVTLSASAVQQGALITDYGIVSDDETSFFPTIEKAVSENDIVLFSGGSSVGMRDLGEQALSRLGKPGVLVHGVSLKPGKPVIIGLSHKTPVFGLPGHPVSALVCFDLFVKPAIHALSGCRTENQLPEATVTARLRRNINSAAGRLDLVRVKVIEEEGKYEAHPVLGRSGAISSLSRADGYFFIDEDSQGVQEGNFIEVYLYQ